jgi:hypothetical protein
MATARVLRPRSRARHWWWVAALALILLGITGQAGAQDEDALLKAPAGAYRGRVLDAQSGRPIPDAVVVILWQRLDDEIAGLRRLVTALETFTNSDGEFVHDVRAVEAKLPPRTLAPRVLMFRPGYTPVPDRPQVRPPGLAAARFAAPNATATMTAITDLEDRSEAFNTFVAMLSAAQLFPATPQLPETAELLRFELQTLGARPLPEPARGGR